MTKGAREKLIREAISDRLRVLRTESGASQTQLATAMCVSVTQYQKYESGENRISSCKVVMLCEFLKRQPNDLLDNLKLKRK